MRAKSVVVDFLLTSVCLSHGDNACHVGAARRVGNHDNPAFERTDANEPFLSVIDTVIYEGDAAPG
jgi:hypothetical protein